MTSESHPPHPRYEHWFAIVRYETDSLPHVPVELRITVKKIVADAAFADAEVKRLNELNRGKGCFYFTQVTRLQRESPTATVSDHPAETHMADQ